MSASKTDMLAGAAHGEVDQDSFEVPVSAGNVDLDTMRKNHLSADVIL